MEILAQAARRLAQYLRQRSGSRHRPLSDLDALRSSLSPSSGQRRVSRLDDWFPPRQFVVRQSGGHSG